MDLGCGAAVPVVDFVGGGGCFFVGAGGCFLGGGGGGCFAGGGGVGCFSGGGGCCFSGDDVGCCRCGVLQARSGWCLASCSAGRLEGASLLLRLAFPLLDIIGGFSFELTLSFSLCSTRLCESVVGSL